MKNQEELTKVREALGEEGREALKEILDYISTICDFDEPDEVMTEFAAFMRYFQAKHILDQAILDGCVEEGDKEQ